MSLRTSPFAVDGFRLLKAVPHTEGDRRLIYIEPSDEGRDIEGDIVRQSVLERAAPYYLRHGNIDIAHRSLGESSEEEASEDGLICGRMPDHWEIGRPIDIRFNPIRVKAEIYRSTGPTIPPHLEAAEEYWLSQTSQDPPKTYFPSIGGLKLHKSCDDSGCDLDDLLWTNIGLWRSPMHPAVRPVSLVPFEVFAKALVAGYGTDVRTLTGGAATRKESLHGAHDHGYVGAAARFMKAVQTGACEHARPPLSAQKIIDHFRECEKLADGTASRFAVKLVTDVARRVNRARQHPAAKAA